MGSYAYPKKLGLHDLVGWDLTDTRIKPKMVLGLYEQLANYLSEVEKVQESAK